jgi:hypothetical protein
MGWVDTRLTSKRAPDMLLIVIPIAWLATAMLTVALCAAAARGEAAMLAAAQSAREPVIQARRLHGSVRARRRAPIVRGVRGRGGRCVGGS